MCKYTKHDRERCVRAVIDSKEQLSFFPIFTPAALNITVPSFSSTSIMAFPALPSNFSVTISITFFPTEQHGLLLFSSQANNDLSRYMLVALLDSHVLYVFNTGSGKAVINSTSILSLHEWHTITVTLTGHTGALQVNGDPTLSMQAPGMLSSVMLNSFMWLGGVMSYASISNLIGISSGFSGCVSNVFISNQELDLIMDAEMGYGIGNCNSSMCEDNPCRNGATCLEMSNNYVCECPNGFIGPLCGFTEDPCANPSMCVNGGTCQPSADGQPNCLCPLNKGGEFCEQGENISLLHIHEVLKQRQEYHHFACCALVAILIECKTNNQT